VCDLSGLGFMDDEKPHFLRMKMSLKILGRKVKIKLIAQDKLAAISKDEHTIGLFDPNKMTIFISSDLSERDRLYILAHEATHCLHYITGLDQSHSLK
jgi:Zn-dependent peptidase ImmA (M78 family)